VLSPWQESADACGVPPVSPLEPAFPSRESTADAAAGRAVRGLGCPLQNLCPGGASGTAYFVLSPRSSGPSTGMSTPTPTTPTKPATQQVPARTTFVWPASLSGMGPVTFDTSSLHPPHAVGKCRKADADRREKMKLYSPSSLEASYAGLEEAGTALARSPMMLPRMETDLLAMAAETGGPGSWGDPGQRGDAAADVSELSTTPPTPPAPPLEFAGQKELLHAPAALSKAVAVAGDCEARLRALREVGSRPSFMKTDAVQPTSIPPADKSSYRSLQSELEEARERAKGLEARCRVMEEERQDLRCRVEKLESIMQRPQASIPAEPVAPAPANVDFSLEAARDLRGELARARADAARAEARRAELEASAEAERARAVCAEAASFRGTAVSQHASRFRAWSPMPAEQQVGANKGASAQQPVESAPVQSARTSGRSLRGNVEMIAAPAHTAVTAEHRVPRRERPTPLDASPFNPPTRGDARNSFHCLWELPSPAAAFDASGDAHGCHQHPQERLHEWQRELPTPTRSLHRPVFSSRTPRASEDSKPTRGCSHAAEQFNLSPISARSSDRCVPRVALEDVWFAGDRQNSSQLLPSGDQPEPFRAAAAPVDASRRILQAPEGEPRSANRYGLWGSSASGATEAPTADATFEEQRRTPRSARFTGSGWAQRSPRPCESSSAEQRQSPQSARFAVSAGPQLSPRPRQRPSAGETPRASASLVPAVEPKASVPGTNRWCQDIYWPSDLRGTQASSGGTAISPRRCDRDMHGTRGSASALASPRSSDVSLHAAKRSVGIPVSPRPDFGSSAFNIFASGPGNPEFTFSNSAPLSARAQQEPEHMQTPQAKASANPFSSPGGQSTASTASGQAGTSRYSMLRICENLPRNVYGAAATRNGAPSAGAASTSQFSCI